jgi:hypothetical protein
VGDALELYGKYGGREGRARQDAWSAARCECGCALAWCGAVAVCGGGLRTISVGVVEVVGGRLRVGAGRDRGAARKGRLQLQA